MKLPMTTDSSGDIHVPDCASYEVRQEERNQSWNLEDLGARLTVDAASAAIAAGLVAPIVTVIDNYAFRWEPFVIMEVVARRGLAE